MKKIHITLLGKETLPIYYLVSKNDYDMVYILATDQNKPLAKRLKTVLIAENIVCKIVVVDAFDVRSTITACEDIHSLLEDTDQVVYNITGGTKLMAIGAYNVAIAHGSKVIYTNSDSLVDLTTFEKAPLDISIDSKTIFALQGQDLKEYTLYTHSAEKLKCSEDIMSFNKNNGKLFSQLRKLYDEYHSCGMAFNRYPQTGTPVFEHKGNRIQIWANGSTALDITCKDSMPLIFEGRWWETLVAEAISQWSNGRFEVWQNVKFGPRNPDLKILDKNEIDILVNTGNKLLFVECKSGKITQDNINKMSVIRQTYGSDKSMSVLISYHPIQTDLAEKAHEAKLNIIKSLEEIPLRLDRILTSIKA